MNSLPYRSPETPSPEDKETESPASARRRGILACWVGAASVMIGATGILMSSARYLPGWLGSFGAIFSVTGYFGFLLGLMVAISADPRKHNSSIWPCVGMWLNFAGLISPFVVAALCS